MADHTDPEVIQGPAESLKTAVPAETETPSDHEISAPMLDVHAPHQLVHTWKDFFIHIATICVGLLIALGLEQTVEALHHHHQREQLLVSLDRDTRATLQDADFAVGEYLRRIQWDQVRIGELGISHRILSRAYPP